MFLDSLDHKDGSIYKLNKSSLNKLQPSLPLTRQNSLVFAATDKAELMANSLERQFTTNPSLDIPGVTEIFQSIENLQINNSNHFIIPRTV